MWLLKIRIGFNGNFIWFEALFLNNKTPCGKILIAVCAGKINQLNMDALHSRISTEQKELTDINALTDEYLRLSYHGLRAKDKTLSAGQAGFNATLQTDFDSTIDKINIVPQDIGRVLLNLFNNAFYSVMQKKKELNGIYEPIVSVCTKKLDNKIEIHVRDNGVGIPQKVVDKIFQPFFTTKPTGQGTGLGLSLSYDI